MTSRARRRAIVSLIAVGGLALVAAGPVAVVAWRTPVTDVQTTELDTVGLSWSVTGTGARSRVYPDGVTGTVTDNQPSGEGEAPTVAVPWFTSLLDELTIEAVATGLTEPMSVDVYAVTADGVRERLSSHAGGLEGITLELPVGVGRAVVEELSVLTGANPTRSLIELVPTLDGVAMDPLEVTDTGRTITVAGEFMPALPGEATVERFDTTIAWFGAVLDTATARLVSSIVVVAGLALLMVAAGLVLRNPIARFRILYGSHVVDVDASASAQGPFIRTNSMAELVRLAKRDQRMVLHQVLEGEMHRWLLPDLSHTYEFVLVDGRVPEPAAVPVVEPEEEPVDAFSHVVDGPEAAAIASRPHPGEMVGVPLGRPVQVASLTELEHLWRAQVGADRAPIRRSPASNGWIRYSLQTPTALYTHTAPEPILPRR